MGYLHVEIKQKQTAKQPGHPCGDVVQFHRTANATTVIVADGLGSGINAHVAATMAASRFMELIRADFSVRKAFGNLVKTINQARGSHMSYAAFTVAQIHSDGNTTVLTYEAPTPVLVNKRQADVLPMRTVMQDKAMVAEADCFLRAGEGVLLFSDGITQAGMGLRLPNGWGSDGVCRYANDIISQTRSFNTLADQVHAQADEYWGPDAGDDITAVLLNCRWGKTVNILTGPPSSPYKDAAVIKNFMQQPDVKIVCGATTAKIAAKYLNKELKIETDPMSMVAPPMYFIQDVDLVTEGAVTLNQLYNILDEQVEAFDEISGVTELYEHLQAADRVHITLGVAVNPASHNISFRQRGILSRHKIVSLLAEKLRERQKLVIVDCV